MKFTSIHRVASVEARGKPNALDKGGEAVLRRGIGARSGGGGDAQDRSLLIKGPEAIAITGLAIRCRSSTNRGWRDSEHLRNHPATLG